MAKCNICEETATWLFEDVLYCDKHYKEEMKRLNKKAEREEGKKEWK